jgi:hypothetical protein
MFGRGSSITARREKYPGISELPAKAFSPPGLISYANDGDGFFFH